MIQTSSKSLQVENK